MKHALTVDVEDWFQVLNLAGVVDRGEWDRLELRCGEATHRLLELFDRRGARATFFFLGWIAERLPGVVRAVRDAGHEIGSHGYDHRCLDDLGREGFVGDLARTEDVLAGITGERPRTFRACTWSVTARTPWALDVLVERGYRTDSSVYPVAHPEYGVGGAPWRPYRVRTTTGEITELPPLTLGLLGRRLPVGGGGYLRLFPLAVLRAGLRQMERAGVPGCVYLHPWEIDPHQPRRPVRGLRRLRHYVNLGRTYDKLDRLLQRVPFTTVEGALGQVDELPVVRAAELLSARGG